MKTLRWKPLKSSVKQARSLTGILEAINLIISGLIISAGSIGLINGQVVVALVCFLLGVATYLTLKMAYIALELLTEIADDTRLQLMALAGDEYDQTAGQGDASIEESLPKEDLSTSEIYNEAVKGYMKTGWKRVSSFEDSTIVSNEKVVLRDSNGNTIMTMVLRDGEWMRK